MVVNLGKKKGYLLPPAKKGKRILKDITGKEGKEGNFPRAEGGKKGESDRAR